MGNGCDLSLTKDMSDLKEIKKTLKLIENDGIEKALLAYGLKIPKSCVSRFRYDCEESLSYISPKEESEKNDDK